MDILQKTIHSLSKEEIINYKQYSKRIRDNGNRKDILLFDLLKNTSNNDANDGLIFNKLYPKTTNRNTYHRLKSRLLSEIDTSVVLFHFHKTDLHYIHNEISLYKTYLKKSEWDIALYHLKKAEKKAIELHDYLMLDVIYTEYINLSIQQYGKLAPDIYINKRKENASKLNDLRLLDDAIANIYFDILQSQNFSKTNTTKFSLLNNAIKQIHSKKAIKHNVVFKSKLYSAISNLLLTQKDYVTLEQYAIKTYHDFLKYNLFAIHNHQIKLQMLMYICNTLFINKKHTIALEYIQKLKMAMHEFKNLLHDNYVFFYYNSLANNYSEIDPNKAVAVLNEAKKIKAIKNHPTHLGYIYLNLAGAYFDLNKHKLALKNIIDLYQCNAFENLGESVKLNIAITEIVLRVETLHFDYTLQLIKSALKKHAILLVNEEYKQVKDFLVLMEKLLKKNSFDKNRKNTELISAFQKTKYKQESNTVLNYKKWLIETFNLQ